MSGKLNPEERKVLIIWVIVGIIIFFLVLGYKGIYLDSKDEDKYLKNYKMVQDYNRYYTVMGAISKYYSFANASSYESVLHILDANYVKKNSITVDNISDFINNDVSLSYSGGIMCFKELDKGITSYIVEGNEAVMNTGEVISKKYYNVILDGNEFVFSIEPIEEEYFGGNCNG